MPFTVICPSTDEENHQLPAAHAALAAAVAGATVCSPTMPATAIVVEPVQPGGTVTVARCTDGTSPGIP